MRPAPSGGPKPEAGNRQVTEGADARKAQTLRTTTARDDGYAFIVGQKGLTARLGL
jgi:hypothetical protein